LRAAFKANPQSAQAAYNLGVLLSKEHPRRRSSGAAGPPHWGRTTRNMVTPMRFTSTRQADLTRALQAIRLVRERHPAHEDSAMFEQALLREQKAAASNQ